MIIHAAAPIANQTPIEGEDNAVPELTARDEASVTVPIVEGAAAANNSCPEPAANGAAAITASDTAALLAITPALDAPIPASLGRYCRTNDIAPSTATTGRNFF